MSRKTIPVEVKQKCVELYDKGVPTEKLYKEHYLKYGRGKLSTFERLLRKWRNKTRVDNELLEKANLSYKFTPHATTVQVDKNGEIIQSWIKGKSDDRLYLDLIEHIANLPKLELEEVKLETTEDYMLEIPLYDLHFGIADFNYYKSTLAEVIDLIQRRNYKEINIIIGQDLFHNDDFRGRTASGREIEYTDITVAWEDARKFYYKIIEESLKQSKKTRIIYSKGNHDESMSWAFVQMIKAQFKDADNITIDDEVKERKLITFGTNFIGITHGEKGQAKSRNLNNMFVIEYPQEFAKSKVREIHAGHLHHERIKDDFGIMARRLSSGNITDTWHCEQGYVGAHKRFMVFEWTKEKLAAIYYV